MRKLMVGVLTVSLASGLGVSLGPSAVAAPPADSPATAVNPSKDAAHRDDDLPNPLEDKRRELREQAVSDVISGRAKPETRNGSTVVKVGQATNATGPLARKAGKATANKDQYVELARERTDEIFVILTEFGNERHPDFPDVDSDPSVPGPARFDGPLRNQIPEPNRAVDNSTVWQADYTADYYRQLYFGTGAGVESVKTYYEAQSSGRYSVEGQVTNWTKVKYNEARYGRDACDACAGGRNIWALVSDAANQWVADQKAAGRSDAEIAASVKAMDKWDRYDHDGDGNFNESDGYIDHFQIVHAGGDEADGDPWQGEDAIWSHRWYAYQDQIGATGPATNPLGGTQIGNTGIWIGDYTVQPENGGLSVFVHEYGHDLGLPDDYNINNGGDNNNEHWTLMAQSRLSAKDDPAIGTRPGDLGAWNKLQLGWLDYETVVAGQKKTINLGPQEYNTARPQAVVVVLPKRAREIDNGAPFEGEKQWFSGNEDDLRSSLTAPIDLTGKSSATLAAKVRYSIEAGYDYMYLEASADGSTWTPLNGTVDGHAFSQDSAGRPVIDGESTGWADKAWVDLSVPLDAYAGKNIQFRFRYVTDGGVSKGGLMADAITVTADGATVLSDGAEGDGAFVADGFSQLPGSETRYYDNYYIAGHRSYVSYDKYLKTGPYFFGYTNTMPDKVDHYAYQQGLLISYWDTFYADNDTFDHPGEGRNMIIDAHPKPFYRIDGQPWRARVQVYDATFGLTKADSFTLHVNGQPSYIRGQDAKPVFDDTKAYWFPELPNHGVKLPAVGVKIRVVEVDGTTMKIRIS
ncbi:protease [Phytohabitans aurantiacus]|uniref:Protease n=1 Tax=Phytohabitans aurantiacus TaxID=3016789 RepID=A0ABQ5QMH3_9ACTN|nr:protease [Phytohabitans aurantiacus]